MAASEAPLRKTTCTILVGLALAAGPALALEPGDLVVSAGDSLFGVDPDSGETESLVRIPFFFVTGMAIDTDAGVFFATAWVFDIADPGCCSALPCPCSSPALDA